MQLLGQVHSQVQLGNEGKRRRVLDDHVGEPQTLAMVLSAVLMPAEEGGFIALNPETGTTTQGDSVPEALANLREATGLYLDEFPISLVPKCNLVTRNE